MLFNFRNGHDLQASGVASQQGFTLIEVIFAVIILGVLATVGTNMIYSGFVTSNYVNAENSAVASGRYALERISREMRESDKGSVTLGSNQIGFTRERQTLNTVIKYDAMAKRLTMAPAETGQDYILAENVVSFDCAYRYPINTADLSEGFQSPEPRCSAILASPPLATALTKIELLLEIQDNQDSPKLPMNKIVILRNNL